MEQYSKQYPNIDSKYIKKEVEKQINSIHPSIKGYFKPSGEPYKGAGQLLERYEEED